MLTDYHVHLRPDDVEATAARYLTAANAERYRTVASERGIAELGVAEHVHRFRQALGERRPRPEGDLRRFYEPAVEAMAEAGVAVEVSSAGWRKPVGELYPAPAFLEMVIDAGCPLALSSDAHVPDELGYRYEDALELLDGLGVGELCVFDARERRLEPIG